MYTDHPQDFSFFLSFLTLPFFLQGVSKILSLPDPPALTLSGQTDQVPDVAVSDPTLRVPPHLRPLFPHWSPNQSHLPGSSFCGTRVTLKWKDTGGPHLLVSVYLLCTTYLSVFSSQGLFLSFLLFLFPLLHPLPFLSLSSLLYSRDGIWTLTHGRQVLYHQALCPALGFLRQAIPIQLRLDPPPSGSRVQGLQVYVTTPTYLKTFK